MPVAMKVQRARGGGGMQAVNERFQNRCGLGRRTNEATRAGISVLNRTIDHPATYKIALSAVAEFRSGEGVRHKF